jgi:cysteine desulfurase
MNLNYPEAESDTCSKHVHEIDYCIYLDYNATTPVHPAVFEAMTPFLKDYFGNPSSSHMYGDVPKTAILDARRAVLSLLSPKLSMNPYDDSPSRIIFTGCGSESDNLAIYLSIHSSTNTKNKHVVTSNVEHPAVLQTLKVLEEKGEVRSNSEGSFVYFFSHGSSVWLYINITDTCDICASE